MDEFIDNSDTPQYTDRDSPQYTERDSPQYTDRDSPFSDMGATDAYEHAQPVESYQGVPAGSSGLVATKGSAREFFQMQQQKSAEQLAVPSDRQSMKK